MNVVKAAIGHDDYVIARSHLWRQKVHDLISRSKRVSVFPTLSNAFNNPVR